MRSINPHSSSRDDHGSVGAVYDRTSFEPEQRALIERTYTRSLSFAGIVIGSCIAILIASVAGPALASPAADAPLADAAMHGDIDAVRSLLDQSVDVNAPQGDGTTALHWAAYRDDPEIARLLIEADADINAKTRLGDLTPLLLAAKNGNTTLIEILLEAGTDANDADANGTTPLMYSAASGKADAVKVLLESGAEVNATDTTNGQTALMFAASQGRADVVGILAAGGADPDVLTKLSEVIRWKDRYRDEDGNAAVKEDRPESSSGGFTALHFAAREGHLQVTRELVAAGADVNLVAGVGWREPADNRHHQRQARCRQFPRRSGSRPQSCEQGRSRSAVRDDRRAVGRAYVVSGPQYRRGKDRLPGPASSAAGGRRRS